ncbi:hypothetical protein [Nannocystis sp. SCPEA4]|uniref:hypothetical protein n=1 Tax=Nannocystis sp. SCPEA4 TaxID=2996787 RepID=UPI002270F878|nr:hypothetical protein [Nannocystis sp. SCPEA4]MCY1056628.1 hypothetical protein [Nannocystis sp. SCPEA4]
MPSARSATLVALALAACGGPDPSASTSFGVSTLPPLSGTTSSTSSSTSSGSTTTTTSSEPGTDPGSSATAGAPVLDLGVPDLGNGAPPGCKGKIDFLFVIARHSGVAGVYSQFFAAVPQFLAAIQAKFVNFDYHIMVVDGDPEWGIAECNQLPCAPCPYAADYPSCDLIASRTICDFTMGAGTTFNAGFEAANVPCDIPEGRRYLTRDDPDIDPKFLCIAQVGGYGGDRLGEAFVRAIHPDLNAPGGCNAGFLREDAILMVTFLTGTKDKDSAGTPETWAQAALEAKNNDPNSLVMLGITNEPTYSWCADSWDNRVCQFIAQFPYWHHIHYKMPDYVPGFGVATDLIEEACSKFIAA